MFSGGLDELDSAFDAVASSLRPLSPGSVPPPLCLPPPPAAALGSSGNLVIDQPSFLRQKWPQQKSSTAEADRPTSAICPPLHKAPHPPPPPPLAPQQFPVIAEPRVLDDCPPQPLPPAGAILPTFRVKPFSGEAKHWTPSHQQAPAPPAPPPQQQQPGPSTGGQPFNRQPTKWQPTETPILVRSHAEVNLDPEPEPVETTTSWPTPPLGHVSLKLDHVEGRPTNVEVVPRWALPLRSEYDWREAYYWVEGDEWELTDDGQYCIRKSKNQPLLLTGHSET